MEIANVLASRYASAGIKEIWSPEGRIRLEREFWIAVMKAQRDLGLDIPEKAIDDYIKVKDKVDLESIEARERVTRHDVKARIEEFCELAGHEHIHKGMTSRDLTENVEQLQIFRSLKLIRDKGVSALVHLGEKSAEYKELMITARTHNVAAQPTTFGKRLAMFGQEILLAMKQLEHLIQNYPVRGLKGAVGTRLDQLTLFGQDSKKVDILEKRIIKHLGIPSSLGNVGQVYPRSLDFQVLSTLYQLSCGPASFAKTMRIMAGNETASEGFAKGQVGSSAMPHKMNSRSCERIGGFQILLRGYMEMAASLGGDQWNEGDVSCSVVRRVILPDSFFAMDGLMETFLTILKQMETFPGMMEKENAHYLPFLITTTLLMEAVKKGAGREEAHQGIKELAVETVLELRKGTKKENDLLKKLAQDKRLGLRYEEMEELMSKTHQLFGSAVAQVESFLSEVAQWAELYPQGARYEPGDIL